MRNSSSNLMTETLSNVNSVRQAMQIVFDQLREIDMVRIRPVLLLALTLLSFFLFTDTKLVYAQQTEPTLGKMAPSLTATTDGKLVPVFQKGRVYVLEFWASWCGSCLASFEHLNGLVRAMKSEPVTFLSITGDKKVLVEKLLKTRPLETQVVYDVNNKTFDTYGVRVIPHTVIIDKNGNIAAITDPQSVTEAALRDVLAGRAVHLTAKTNIAADLDWDKAIDANAPEAIAHVVLQRSNADSGALRFRPNSGRIVGDGIGLPELIQSAYGAKSYEIKNYLPIVDQKRFRVSVAALDGKDATARTMLVGVLPTIAEFTATWHEEEATVPVLKRTANTVALKGSKELKYDGFAQTGNIEYVAAPMKEVAATLAGILYNTDVSDETGYTGVYDIKLEWTPGDEKSLQAALKSYGIQIVMEKRTVRRLWIQPTLLVEQAK
ncbi:MAG: TIGR03435 family protein [Proteobacteria bacterium]|nr:MAG: TIGR03435 family protein [Pseudomonadota bacterium]